MYQNFRFFIFFKIYYSDVHGIKKSVTETPQSISPSISRKSIQQTNLEKEEVKKTGSNRMMLRKNAVDRK